MYIVVLDRVTLLKKKLILVF